MAIYVRFPSIELFIRKVAFWELFYKREVRDICTDYEIQIGKLLIQMSPRSHEPHSPKAYLIELG